MFRTTNANHWSKRAIDSQTIRERPSFFTSAKCKLNCSSSFVEAALLLCIISSMPSLIQNMFTVQLFCHFFLHFSLSFHHKKGTLILFKGVQIPNAWWWCKCWPHHQPMQNRAALILEDHKKTLATAEEFSLILPQCRFGNYLGKNL